MTIETFKYIGSVHLLPHVSITYESEFCNGCINVGWLWWGVSFITKDELHL